MLRRHVTDRLRRALTDTPIVFLTGPRQAGKTTLARSIAAGRRRMRYLTLDDAATLAAARSDAAGFVAALEAPTVLDEVQRAPELFPAIKLAVDRRRVAGRFLLTGSANVLLLPTLSESLAGRMEIVRLWPFSQGEIEGVREGFVDSVFARAAPLGTTGPLSKEALLDRAIRGGYPDAFRRSNDRRRAWFESYVTTILQRDVRDLAEIEGLTALPRLLALVAARSGSLLNFAELSRSTGIAQSTLKRYLTLLETTYLVRTVPAWTASRAKRLIRTPKLAVVDSGLLAHLSGLTAPRLRREPTPAGLLLESFVAAELWKQLGWSRTRGDLFHFRTHGGQEVDLVLERDDGRLVGIEVKASATVGSQDFKGLRVLREISGHRFHRGIVLYTGEEALPFGPGLFALPLSCLWQLGASAPTSA